MVKFNETEKAIIENNRDYINSNPDLAELYHRLVKEANQRNNDLSYTKVLEFPIKVLGVYMLVSNTNKHFVIRKSQTTGSSFLYADPDSDSAHSALVSATPGYFRKGLADMGFTEEEIAKIFPVPKN